MTEYLVRFPLTQSVEADSPEEAKRIAIAAALNNHSLWWPGVDESAAEVWEE